MCAPWSIALLLGLSSLGHHCFQTKESLAGLELLGKGSGLMLPRVGSLKGEGDRCFMKPPTGGSLLAVLGPLLDSAGVLVALRFGPVMDV